MKSSGFFRFVKWGVVLSILGGGGYWFWQMRQDRKAEAAKPHFRTVVAGRTDIVCTVEATGTVQPIKKVEVGTQVNGKIVELHVDYNSVVTNGQLVAKIDPKVYQATYDSTLGQLHQNQANVAKCEAALILAEKTLARKEALVKTESVREADYDTALEARDSARASLAAARAMVEQNEASVRQAKANLDYCTIVSPVDGVVIERSVDEGQTVVSSMNAVALVTIATDLGRIQVEATVPEADVGVIKEGQSVVFTADAYRREFKGVVRQIRLASATENNVVTYPIIIEADNPEEMLFPGMTATISVETARAANALSIPNSAFRFRPRSEDLPPDPPEVSDAEREARRGTKRVWTIDANGVLSPVFVKTGVTDSTYTELIGCEELEGREIVIGYDTAAQKQVSDDETTNPFMPKPPQRGKNKGTAPAPKK